jgi:Lrp/AsnC family transcriptional regulator, regulator for asnA, asnC and gidA
MAHTPGTPLAPGGRRRGDGSLRGVPGGRLPGSASRGDRGGRPPGAARHRGNGSGQARVLLDDISKEIIEQLQQDGRRSYAAIGKAVGLSEAAVRQRVQRLIDGGAMQIVAVTDPMTLGFRRQTMIGVRCSGDLERVADQLAAMDEIDYVVIIAGSFDLLIEVVCEDDDQLLEILSRVRSIPSVTATETFVYLRLRKQTYSWGTR